MKKVATKNQIRSELASQIDDFLQRGGEVSQVQQGISGRENAIGPINNRSMAFQQPRQERTYIPEVIAALDERKKPKEKTKPKHKPRLKKKIIYDDFGEPLRFEWIEE